MMKKTTKRRKLYKKRPMKYRRYRSMPKPENKHYDVNLSQNVVTAGTLTLLSNIGQGVDDTQRVGNTLHLRSLFLNILVKQNAVSLTDNVRIMIVRDKQNYNTPAISDILEPGVLGAGLAPLAHYNHYYMSRFKVLYDKIFSISTGGGESFHIKKWIPLFCDSHYIGASTVFKNQIYLVHVGDNTNVLALPTINTSARIIYQDD